MKSSPKLSRLIPAVALTLSLGVFATHAFAECDEDQEDMVGKTIATAAQAKVAAIVPGQTKKMINIETCDVTGSGLVVVFKYNVIGSDGLYWATGKAKVTGADVKEMSFTSLSPNLAAASAKSGVKLASN